MPTSSFRPQPRSQQQAFMPIGSPFVDPMNMGVRSSFMLSERSRTPGVSQSTRERRQRELAELEFKQKKKLLSGDLFGIGGGGGQIGQPGFAEPGLGAGAPQPTQPGGYDALQAQLLGLTSRMGESRRQQIGEAFDLTLESSLARLSDRGFGNSMQTDVIARESQEGRQQALTGLEDALLGQQVGVLSNVGLAGLQSQDRFRLAQMQPQLQLLSQLFGSLFQQS